MQHSQSYTFCFFCWHATQACETLVLRGVGRGLRASVIIWAKRIEWKLKGHQMDHADADVSFGFSDTERPVASSMMDHRTIPAA